MKRKIIIFNLVTSFISLLIMFIASIVIIYTQNNKSYENYAINYLALVTKQFDGTNFDELSKELSKTKDIRITIIDTTGRVIIDNTQENITTNHLQRKELQPDGLGKVFIRYSETLHKRMLYVASLKDGYYLRISIAIKDVNQILTVYVGLGILFLCLILGASIYLFNKFNNKNFEIINKNVEKIASLISSNTVSSLSSIDDLPQILDELSTTLKGELTKIKSRENQIMMILDLLNQGIVVINKNAKISFLNKAFKDNFNFSDEVLGYNYLYLFRDVTLQNLIEKSLKEKTNASYLLVNDAKIYDLTIKVIDDDSTLDGVIICLNDVTNEEKIAKIKKDFFQNASHELKSPLTSIIGYLQLISEGMVDDALEIKEFVTNSLNEAKRMNNIIIDMLDLARIEDAKMIIKKQLYLDEKIIEIIDSLKFQLNEKNIKLMLSLEKTLIYSDDTLIDELIRNLIDNAIKYNSQGGEIEIILKNKLLSIRDTGEGIPEDSLERVFERFYRVSKSRSKTLGGTGLGLAIVKHICELYDYKITLTSKLNLGTKVEIDFSTTK